MVGGSVAPGGWMVMCGGGVNGGGRPSGSGLGGFRIDEDDARSVGRAPGCAALPLASGSDGSGGVVDPFITAGCFAWESSKGDEGSV